MKKIIKSILIGLFTISMFIQFSFLLGFYVLIFLREPAATFDITFEIGLLSILLIIATIGMCYCVGGIIYHIINNNN